MVIHPGHHFRLAQLPARRVHDHHAADDVDLPQLHRSLPLPAPKRIPPPLARSRLEQTMPRQDPIHRPLRHHQPTRLSAAQQLHPDPLRTPPWMRPPQLHDAHLHRPGHLMRTRPRPPRTIRQPADALDQIPPDPGMQTLPRHPHRSRHIRDPRTRQHRAHRIQPLLDNRQRNQRQSRPPRPSGIRGTLAEQSGRTRPTSSINWHATVKHHPVQDNAVRTPTDELTSNGPRRSLRAALRPAHGVRAHTSGAPSSAPAGRTHQLTGPTTEVDSAVRLRSAARSSTAARPPQWRLRRRTRWRLRHH
jgi:hypothetical protein